MARAKKALESVPGVRKAEIDFKAKEARVTYHPHQTTIKKMVAALEKAGLKGSFKSWPKKK